MSALLTWAGGICAAWLLVSAVLMIVELRLTPRHDDWD